MEEERTLNINEVDSSLSYEGTLQEGISGVFKVHDGISFRILKVISTCFPSLSKYVEREGEVLELARNVPGITHLVEKYAPNNLHCGAILKEYFGGNELPENASSGVENIIRKTVSDLHSLGIVDLDLANRNIILSLNKQNAKIIDLDSCDVYSRYLETITYDDFMDKKEKDMKDLEYLFR